MGEDVGNENRTSDLGRQTSDHRCELRDAGRSCFECCLTVKIERPRSDVRGLTSEVRGPRPDSCQFRQQMFVRVADHLGHAGQGGDFFRGALRIAAGDHDLRLRIFAMNAAYGGAGILVGGGSYGAGVEHDESGRGGLVGALQAPFQQLAFDGGAVGLGGPAAEICYVESCHVLLAPAPVTSLPGIHADSRGFTFQSVSIHACPRKSAERKLFFIHSNAGSGTGSTPDVKAGNPSLRRADVAAGRRDSPWNREAGGR